VDDSQCNVDAAREFGIHAALFRSPDEFERLLSEVGLLKAAA
jgi:hypothetical protein